MDQARKKALEVLTRWEKRGSTMDPLFDAFVTEDPLLTDLDKAFAREIVYGVLRWRGRLDWIIAAYSRIKPSRLERAILAILRMGAYQILFMDRVPAAAAVDESVKLAKGLRKKETTAFVNGLLRGIAEKRKEITYPDAQTQPIEYIAAFHSHPAWLVSRWVKHYGVEETIALCLANNQFPPLIVRVNTLKTSREQVIQQLHDEGIEASPTPFSPVGLCIKDPPSLASWGPLQQGWLQVQDEAAQLVSLVLAPKPRERILDLCAAPGGKTTHLAELMQNQGEIIAVDVSQTKLAIIKENCERLGITIVKPLALDATRPLPFLPGSFDACLVDAPCTGLGTLRRHPEGKWRIKEADISRLQEMQGQIMRQAAPLVKQGGVLVYSTCTLTAEENEGVIEVFLAEHKEFSLEHAERLLPKGCEALVDEKDYFRTFPHRHNMDGFFAARMSRTAAIKI
jgi:16S rRNA (cytosine967-C5)-methyltransferase